MKNISKSKLRIPEDIIFLIILFLYAIVMVLNDSNFSLIPGYNSIITVARYIIFAVAAGYFLASFEKLKLSKKVLILLVSLIFLNLISFAYSGLELNVVLISLMTLISTRSSMKQIAATYMIGYVLGCLLVFAAANAGIIKDTINNRYSSDPLTLFILKSDYYTRHSFGFIFSNQVPFALLTVYFLLVFLWQDRLALIVHVIIEILNVNTFIYCGSRFVFVVILFLTLGSIAFKYTNRFHWHLPKWTSYFFIFTALVSLGLIVFYNKIPIAWNVFLNFRISNAYNAIQQSGLHFFRTDFATGTANGVGGLIIDNGYLMLMVQRGLLFAAIILIWWTEICKIVVANNRKYVFLILVLLAMENFIDYQIISYRFFPLFCIIVHKHDELIAKR
jgi:hypothetical protein